MALSIITFSGNSENGNAGSFDVPDNAAMQAGDVRYVMASISNGTISTPLGWANISGSPGVVASTRRIYVFRKVHSGSESTTTFTFSASNNHSWVQFAARGADTTTPEDVGLSVDSDTTGTSITAPSVTTVTDDAVLVSMHAVFITSSGATLSLPSGMTSIATGSGSGGAGHLYRGASEARATAGTTGTRTATSSGSGAWGAGAFAIRPGGANVSGTVAASLGSLSASAAGTRTVPGAVAASLGALSVTVSGTVTPPVPLATSALGGLAATVAGARTALGSAVSSLGVLAASVAGTRTAVGSTVTAGLGGLSATVVGATTVEVTSATVQARSVRYELVVVARVMQKAGPPVLIDVDALDWSGLAWSDELSRPQRLDASVRINSLSPEVIERLRDMANLPSELHLYRDGTRVFAGPWVAALAQGETLTIQGMGLLGYLRYRDIITDFVFTQADQFQIVKSLVDGTQGHDYGDVGIDTSAIGTSGVLRDATYRLFDRHNIGQRIEEMGARANGFDIEVDPQSRALQLWSPAKGTDRSEGDSAVVFDARNITDTTVSWSVAPGDVASLTVAIGTSDKDPVYGQAINTELWSKFGLAMHTESFDGVSDQDTIDDHAQAALDVRDQALLIPGPSVRVDADLDLDGWGVGDTVAYQLHDVLRVRGAFRARKRTVSVDQAGRERVSVEFA